MFLARCLVEIKGGADATDTVATVKWSGTSNPVDEDTNFDYDVKIRITILYAQTSELPDF